MVRSAITFAVFALGAASALAQAIENEVDIQSRDLTAEVEARDIVEPVEARDFLEEYADIDARNDEVFSDLDAREVEEVFEYLRDVSKDATPSKTVTVTHTKQAKATACSSGQLRTIKDGYRVAKAKNALSAYRGKVKHSFRDRMRARHAKKVLRRHARKARARKARLARLAAKKAAASAKAPAATKPASKVAAADASKITKAPTKKSKKSNKKSKKTHKKVGKNGITTIHVTTTAAAAQCSAPSAYRRLQKLSKVKREFDDELDTLFERENDFDELD